MLRIPPTVRRFAGPAAAVGLLLALFTIDRASDAVGIAVAYKAKMLCSGVFVAGRQPADVIPEFELDDLKPLRFIRTKVNSGEGTVRASALGLVTRTAVARGSTGCALIPQGNSRSESLDLSVRDTVDIRSRRPAAALPEAPANDSVRVAIAPVVAAAFAEPDSSRRQRTQAIVVMHRGRIVAEQYAPGITSGTRLLGWSMTKSVLNALVGILVRQGRLTVDGPVSFPPWRSPDDPRHVISIDHLLRMTTGLPFDEGMNGLRSDVVRMLFSMDDMASYAASRPLAYPPGTHWAYSSGTSVILAAVIREIFQDDAAYVRFPREELFDRIGMRSAVIETDASGTFVGSSLMYATARDWARFGQLYLNRGVWNGEQILPENWVSYTRTPTPADSTHGYGAHFWLGVPTDPGAPVTSLSPGMLQAAGHEGQYITILPIQDLVIVRLGRTRRGNWDQAAFARAIMAKVR